jgi:hypothetical protein
MTDFTKLRDAITAILIQRGESLLDDMAVDEVVAGSIADDIVRTLKNMGALKED